MTHNTPTPREPDKTLAERLARLASNGVLNNYQFLGELNKSYRSGQLITLAEAQAMVAAERERAQMMHRRAQKAEGAVKSAIFMAELYSGYVRASVPNYYAMCALKEVLKSLKRAAATATKEGDKP